jgi:hypothetical protein
MFSTNRFRLNAFSRRKMDQSPDFAVLLASSAAAESHYKSMSRSAAAAECFFRLLEIVAFWQHPPCQPAHFTHPGNTAGNVAFGRRLPRVPSRAQSNARKSTAHSRNARQGQSLMQESPPRAVIVSRVEATRPPSEPPLRWLLARESPNTARRPRPASLRPRD